MSQYCHSLDEYDIMARFFANSDFQSILDHGPAGVNEYSFYAVIY